MSQGQQPPKGIPPAAAKQAESAGKQMQAQGVTQSQAQASGAKPQGQADSGGSARAVHKYSNAPANTPGKGQGKGQGR